MVKSAIHMHHECRYIWVNDEEQYVVLGLWYWRRYFENNGSFGTGKSQSEGLGIQWDTSFDILNYSLSHETWLKFESFPLPNIRAIQYDLLILWLVCVQRNLFVNNNVFARGSFSVCLVKLFIPKQSAYVMRGYFDQEVKKSRCLVNLNEVVCAMLLLLSLIISI